MCHYMLKYNAINERDICFAFFLFFSSENNFWTKYFNFPFPHRSEEGLSKKAKKKKNMAY